VRDGDDHVPEGVHDASVEITVQVGELHQTNPQKVSEDLEAPPRALQSADPGSLRALSSSSHKRDDAGNAGIHREVMLQGKES